MDDGCDIVDVDVGGTAEVNTSRGIVQTSGSESIQGIGSFED
jgi:hypothetical protein